MDKNILKNILKRSVISIGLAALIAAVIAITGCANRCDGKGEFYHENQDVCREGALDNAIKDCLDGADGKIEVDEETKLPDCGGDRWDDPHMETDGDYSSLYHCKREITYCMITF